MDRKMIDGGTDPAAVLAEALDRRLGRSRPVPRPRSAWFAQLAAPHGLHSSGIMATTPWAEQRTLRQAIENVRPGAFRWEGDENEWAEVAACSTNSPGAPM